MPSTRTTLRAAARTCGVAGDLRVRRRHVRRRARGSAGTGRSARAPAGSAPTAAARAFSLWQDLRALDRLAQLARAGRLERHRARRSRRGTSPRQATSTAPPTPSAHAELLRQPAAQPEAQHLEHGGEDTAPSISAPSRANERRVGRVRPLAQEQRPQPRAEEGAQREADQRQAAGDQALAKPQSAISTVKATMIQSRPVKGAAGYPARVRVCGTTIERGSPGGTTSPQTEPPPQVKSIPPARRRRITHRALPTIGGLAAVSLIAGVMVGAAAPRAPPSARRASFTEAWKRGDYGAMYRLLDPRVAGAPPAGRVPPGLPARRRHGHRRRDIDPGDPDGVDGDTVAVPVVVETRVFGARPRRP